MKIFGPGVMTICSLEFNAFDYDLHNSFILIAKTAVCNLILSYLAGEIEPTVICGLGFLKKKKPACIV